MAMEFFLALCCFGGEPFVDFHMNSTIDPTDWSADVVKDINETAHSSLVQPVEALGVDLAQCQMFNITFTNLADQFLFDNYKANFLCRCPIGRTGQSCELDAPISLALTAETSSDPAQLITMLLVIAAVVLALMGVLTMMVKGCFCDCFGGITRDDPYDKALDPEDVRRCLEKVRENQAAREMVCEPLVSHPPPMVADSYSAPYAHGPLPTAHHATTSRYPSAPPAPPMNYRPPSPPPAYSAIDRSPATFNSTPI